MPLIADECSVEMARRPGCGGAVASRGHSRRGAEQPYREIETRVRLVGYDRFSWKNHENSLNFLEKRMKIS